MDNFETEDTELRRLQERFHDLMEFRRQVESGMTRDTILEAESRLGSTRVLEAYESGFSEAQTKTIALEGVIACIFGAMVAVLVIIVAIIWKITNWFKEKLGLKDDKSDIFTGTAEQIKKVRAVVSDDELQDAIKSIVANIWTVTSGFIAKSFADLDAYLEKLAEDDEFDEENRNNPAAEDFRNPNPITVKAVFDDFMNSLQPQEIDFLTSGQKTKLVSAAIDDFSNSKFGQYVGGIGHEIFEWTELGLEAAKHVGKDESVVKEFEAAQAAKLEKITAKYASHRKTIDAMTSKYLGAQPTGSPNHLYLFHNKPSELFPHLEKIWAEIKVGKMSGEEKVLIRSLEEVTKHYETNIKMLKEREASRERPWPPEEAMLRLANKAHRDILQTVRQIAAIAHFIRYNNKTAYDATMKCFNYIFKVLSIVNRIPHIDRNQLAKCVEIIKNKRMELQSVLQVS